MPSVRTAAEELGVNPNTVVRAYAVLESEGVVQSLPKKGIYVTGDTASAETDAYKALLCKLRAQGVSKETALRLIEEVYQEDD